MSLKIDLKAGEKKFIVNGRVVGRVAGKKSGASSSFSKIRATFIRAAKDTVCRRPRQYGRHSGSTSSSCVLMYIESGKSRPVTTQQIAGVS